MNISESLKYGMESGEYNICKYILNKDLKQDGDGVKDMKQLCDFATNHQANMPTDKKPIVLLTICTQYILSQESKGLSDEALLLFSQIRWVNIQKLYLSDNKIGNKGCKLISRLCLDNIKVVGLHKNSFGKEGLMHLSKAKWSASQNVFVGHNRLGVDSMKWLVRSAWWLGSQTISLGNNQTYQDNCELTFEQVKNILIVSRQRFQYVWLGDNKIDKREKRKFKLLIAKAYRILDWQIKL